VRALPAPPTPPLPLPQHPAPTTRHPRPTPSSLINAREDVQHLSELGVLFLLFEMGLELSLDRLKALAKYAFGMGSLQVWA
jgi:Kef-type K+ transport system membrane component KefB